MKDNIALILFLKCDVTKFRIPPAPLSHNVILRRPRPPLLTCDVIYGNPKRSLFVSFKNILNVKFTYNNLKW